MSDAPKATPPDIPPGYSFEKNALGQFRWKHINPSDGAVSYGTPKPFLHEAMVSARGHHEAMERNRQAARWADIKDPAAELAAHTPMGKAPASPHMITL